MKKIEMPDLSTVMPGSRKKRLKIPGGWMCRLPEATSFDPLTTKIYGRYYQSTGLGPAEAQQEVLDKMNGVFQGAWLRYMAKSVRYWARKYARKYPDTIQKDGTLLGFKPEEIQNTYIPSGKFGKTGKVRMHNILKEMYEEGQSVRQ